MANFEKTFQILKVDEGRHEVTGIACSEAVDSDGEIADYPTAKQAFQKWSGDFLRMTSTSGAAISLGNIRDMHNVRVAGKAVRITYDDLKKEVSLTTEPLPEYWDLISGGFLTCYSIGGQKAWTKREGDFTRYGPILSEVSYVDRGANPDCSFQFLRSDGRIEIRKFQKKGELFVTKSDHAECEKRYGKLAEHSEATAKLYRDAAAHHRKMGAESPITIGSDDKAAGSGLTKAIAASNEGVDGAGGLRRPAKA